MFSSASGLQTRYRAPEILVAVVCGTQIRPAAKSSRRPSDNPCSRLENCARRSPVRRAAIRLCAGYPIRSGGRSLRQRQQGLRGTEKNSIYEQKHAGNVESRIVAPRTRQYVINIGVDELGRRGTDVNEAFHDWPTKIDLRCYERCVDQWLVPLRHQ